MMAADEQTGIQWRITSFSHGTVSVLYYIFAVLVAAVCCVVSPYLFGNVIGYLTLLFFVWAVPWGARRVRSFEQRLRQRSRDDSAALLGKSVLHDSARPAHPKRERYVLYLRPFSSTGEIKILLKSRRTKRYRPTYSGRAVPETHESKLWDDLETVLAEALEPIAKLIALGQPGEQIGAGRILSRESRWTDDFHRLAEGADQILVVPSSHPGTLWEMEQLLSTPALLRKTVFVIPPDDGAPQPLALQRPTGLKVIEEQSSRLGLKDPIKNASRLVLADAREVLRNLQIDIDGAGRPRGREWGTVKDGLLLRVGMDRQVRETQYLCAYEGYNSRLSPRKLSLANIRKAILGE